MPVKIFCPRCGQEYHIEGNLSGMTAKCARCETEFQIPQLPPPPPPIAQLVPVTPATTAEKKPVSIFDRIIMLLVAFFTAILIVVLLGCAFIAFSSGDAQNLQQQIHGAISAQIFLTLIVIILITAVIIKLDSLRQK